MSLFWGEEGGRKRGLSDEPKANVIRSYTDVTCTWKGFYTVSQVILTSVVVRTQFSINILSSYSYTKKNPWLFKEQGQKQRKQLQKTTTTTKSTVILLTLYNTPSLILSDARIWVPIIRTSSLSKSWRKLRNFWGADRLNASGDERADENKHKNIMLQ